MPSVFGAFGKPKVQRSAASDQWTPNDLVAHNITIRPIKPPQFFGHDPLAERIDHLDPALFTTPLPKLVSLVDQLQESTFDVLTYLTWAARAVPGEEAALTDFIGEALQIFNFVYPGSTVKTFHRMPFSAARKGAVESDLSIVSPSGVTFLVAKVKTATSTNDPECEVIEAAIAAFHENNRIRTTKLDMDELEEMEMPAITMCGTHMTFYLVPVSKSMCTGGPAPPVTKQGKNGSKSVPGKRSAVTKCAPVLPPKSPGMEDPQTRKVYFAYMLAFQGRAEASCRALRVGMNE